ncbi:hypothetical protein ACU4GD_33850 [Cupriavidus basilensis]
MPVRDLFTGGRSIDTVLLWIPYFMNLVVLYFIVSWMPAVLIGAHASRHGGHHGDIPVQPRRGGRLHCAGSAG